MSTAVVSRLGCLWVLCHILSNLYCMFFRKSELFQANTGKLHNCQTGPYTVDVPPTPTSRSKRYTAVRDVISRFIKNRLLIDKMAHVRIRRSRQHNRIWRQITEPTKVEGVYATALRAASPPFVPSSRPRFQLQLHISLLCPFILPFRQLIRLRTISQRSRNCSQRY